MKQIDTCEKEQLVSALRECRVALTFYAQWMKDHSEFITEYPYGTNAENRARALLAEYGVTGTDMPRAKVA